MLQMRDIKPNEVFFLNNFRIIWYLKILVEINLVIVHLSFSGHPSLSTLLGDINIFLNIRNLCYVV